MAAGDLTSLANVKQYIGIATAVTTDDLLLSRLISALSTFVQSWLSRTILSASYTDTVDGVGGSKLQFANYPVTAVSNLLINGRAVPAAAVPAVQGWSGYVWTPTQIALQGYCFTRGYSNIVVNYTAGFAAVPLDLEQACIEVIALRYKQRDQIGFVSKAIGGETVTFNIKDMPASCLTVLQNYRRVAPLV
jgi:hypothetical protein